MDNVLDFASRGRPASSPQQAACDCGSQWFRLQRRPTDPPGVDHGAVTLRPDGTVSGYVGEPRCLECGAAWAPKDGWAAY